MPEDIMSDELDKRLKKLGDQMGWILARYADTGDNPKIQKLEIQVNCLRKQVLDIEGKKSYSEEADLEHEQDVKRGLYGDHKEGNGK